MVIELYEHIRSLREDRDLSQKEIAAILGMSQTGYSKYETGENDIPTQILIKLAEYYNTTTDLRGQNSTNKSKIKKIQKLP